MKNIVNGKDVFAILSTGFGRGLNLSTLSKSYVFDECNRLRRLHEHGDSVVYCSHGHNERPS